MSDVAPRVAWFSDTTRERIVNEAYRILEKIGVFVENTEALSLLDGAGATIDAGKRRAYLPGSLVRQALTTVPRCVQLYDRHGDVGLDLGEDRVHFNPGSAALRIYDHELNDARAPLTSDLVEFATLVDALPNYAAQSTGLISSDVPREIADSYRLYIALKFSTKPVVTGTFKVESFRVMHEMLSAVAGGSSQLRTHPLAIFDCCPSPPLTWSDLTCQALIDCARSGLPAELVSMPLAGATAPVTLAGAVTQHCAESLSGVVIHQLAGAGSPIIYGGSPACFDMREGTTPMGAVETMMIDGAYAEIGKYLGLPTHAYMALSDAKTVDFQAGSETAMGAAIAALSGINNVSGPGMLDFESCQSLEKLVLDHEICGMALRLVAGIALRDDPLALPVIAQGIEQREFLSLSHTVAWFRREAYLPARVVDRGTLANWRQSGKKDAVTRAAERVRQLLHKHAPEPLEDDLDAHLRELMESEARRHGMDALPPLT